MCSLNSVSLFKNLILLTYRGSCFNSFRNQYSTNIKNIGEESQAAFYQRLLRKHENDDQIVINKCEEHPDSIKGGSFMSTVTRINLMGYKTAAGKRTNFQKSIAVKNLPPKEQSILFRSNLAMENEAVAYNSIIPALQNYSVNMLPIPNCIYADENMIVLEDLCVEGFKPTCRTNQGLSLEQCRVVLEGLAKLHAASFAFNAVKPEEFEKLASLPKEVMYDYGDSKQLAHHTHRIESTIKLFTSQPASHECLKAVELLADLRDNGQDKIKQLLRSPRPHSVICHGNLLATNIMFNERNYMRLLDLQAMRYNSVATDLCYLLYVNLHPATRVIHMQELLDYYLLSIKTCLKQKDINLDDVLTKEWLKNEMDTYAVYGIFKGMWIMPLFFATEEGLNISKKNLSGAPEPQSFGPEFEKRMRDFVLEYVKSVP